MTARSELATLLILTIVLGGCSKAKTGVPAAPDAAPVEVATVESKAMPIELHAIGNVEARSSVAVKARVAGQVLSVHFAEGQRVAKKALLFRIDPRPFDAALKQAEGALARDRALSKNARIEGKRYEGLVEKEYVTREQYDQTLANAESLEATVRADEAAVENARLELGFCSITSPIDGRAGAILVHAGNLVGANAADPMVVLLETRPIFVTFAVPEKDLAEIRARAGGDSLPVEAVPSGSKDGRSGTLSFVDNTVNASTGTIQLKAIFPNLDDALWPGQFVDVVLRLATEPSAVVVPLPAVLRGQQGAYVFVVKTDSTVELRPVEVSRNVGQEAVVAKGLSAGERVVTDGQLRLGPGARVEIKEPAR
jgi:multidrug efflux system membrane fusion protein